MQIATQLFGYHVKPHTNGTSLFHSAHKQFIQDVPQQCGYHVNMHTNGLTGMRIPRKNAHKWHGSISFCTSKCIQDVPQLCGYDVKMHTNCPTGIRIPHKAHTNVKSLFHLARKNAYKMSDGYAYTT